MANLNSLSLVTELKVDGLDETLKLDFSDKRFVNKLLHLIKKYTNIEDTISDRLKELDNYEDELDKLVAFSDIETSILEEFKSDVNNTFNTDLTGALFGDCLPSIERYYDLFEQLLPYVAEAKKHENEAIKAINKKYGFERIASEG